MVQEQGVRLGGDDLSGRRNILSAGVGLKEWWVGVAKCFPRNTVITSVRHNTVVFTVPVSILYQFLFRLRDYSGCQFKVLVDLTAVDYPGRTARFDVVYHLLSVHYGFRCMVKVQVNEMRSVPSVTSRFMSANWVERECYDMFGIRFEGHPDLRRLLTDYGFEGYPLRKDFPLMGFMEVRYDEIEKRVVSEPLQLAQDLRTYTFGLPWKSLPTSKIVKGVKS